MELLDKLASSGDKTLRSGDWVEKVATKGKDQLLPKVPEDVKPGVEKALVRIVEGKSALGTVSADGFTAITSYLGLGMEDEAKRVFLREHATHAERQNAMKAAAQAAYKGHVASEKAWLEVRAIALDVLKFAGQAAIPLLLAAV